MADPLNYDAARYVQALIALHCGLERQGPGDTTFSNQILSSLKGLPDNPRIADLGCGGGAGALLLAERFNARVRAVDLSRDFLDELMTRARQRGLDSLIEAIEGDIGNLDWPPASADLLWSEGAAYHLTFAGALRAWRPLMATNGLAIISEMSFFNDAVPDAVRDYWQQAYPAIGTEATNSGHAEASGFEVLEIRRLPASAWWDNYYDPLSDNMAPFSQSADPVMRLVTSEIDEEMALFKTHHQHYGYSFYIMKAL